MGRQGTWQLGAKGPIRGWHQTAFPKCIAMPCVGSGIKIAFRNFENEINNEFQKQDEK